PLEAADAVNAFRPAIVYPYHYRGSDPMEFANALKGTGIEVRIRDWYAEDKKDRKAGGYAWIGPTQFVGTGLILFKAPGKKLSPGIAGSAFQGVKQISPKKALLGFAWDFGAA